MWDHRDYKEAREEHAMLLRTEGLKLREIAERLGGISRDRARVLVMYGARRLIWATRRTKYHIINGDGVPLTDADYRRIEWQWVKAEALANLSVRRKRRKAA